MSIFELREWRAALALAALVTLSQNVTAGETAVANGVYVSDIQHDGYVRNGDNVVYRGRVVAQVDAATFIDLGKGYGKDRYSVFFRGERLPYVDPVSFRLKSTDGDSWDGSRGQHFGNGDHFGNGEYIMREPMYMKDSFNVYYRGRKVSGASPNSFVELYDGYAKDAFNVYRFGKKLSGVSPNSFVVMGDGYSRDAFNVYFDGKKMAGASPNSFEVVGGGYSKDAFHVYYFGEKIQGASSSSFIYNDGRAYDNTHHYNKGHRVRE